MHQTSDSIQIEVHDYDREKVYISSKAYGVDRLKCSLGQLKLVLALKFEDQMDKREWDALLRGILHQIRTRFIESVSSLPKS